MAQQYAKPSQEKINLAFVVAQGYYKNPVKQ